MPVGTSMQPFGYVDVVAVLTYIDHAERYEGQRTLSMNSGKRAKGKVRSRTIFFSDSTGNKQMGAELLNIKTLSREALMLRHRTDRHSRKNGYILFFLQI